MRARACPRRDFAVPSERATSSGKPTNRSLRISSLYLRLVLLALSLSLSPVRIYLRFEGGSGKGGERSRENFSIDRDFSRALPRTRLTSTARSAPRARKREKTAEEESRAAPVHRPIPTRRHQILPLGTRSFSVCFRSPLRDATRRAATREFWRLSRAVSPEQRANIRPIRREKHIGTIPERMSTLSR